LKTQLVILSLFLFVGMTTLKLKIRDTIDAMHHTVIDGSFSDIGSDFPQSQN